MPAGSAIDSLTGAYTSLPVAVLVAAIAAGVAVQTFRIDRSESLRNAERTGGRLRPAYVSAGLAFLAAVFTAVISQMAVSALMDFDGKGPEARVDTRTQVIATCGSRYTAVMDAAGEGAIARKVGDQLVRVCQPTPSRTQRP